ncbi:sulfite exporter TauE/SafE family protein [bacterium]|nr:sulfite exporter TauE/SafE family protein [bacterium]
MHAPEIIALLIAATAAGAINAVAGGGTLVTFPVLLFFGTSPVVANATNTLALVFGTAGSLYGYRRHFDEVKPWLWRFLPVSLLGGLIGGILLTRTSNELFGKLVPFLILFATILFLAQGAFRQMAGLNNTAGRSIRHQSVIAAVLFQFAVAVYGGFFGAGIGILMLASLGFIGLTHIHEMNALKNILGSMINLVAAAWFVAAGLIDWPRALIMTVGALGGYFLGAHYSQRISQRAVRVIITTIGFVISAVTFYKQFCG